MEGNPFAQLLKTFQGMASEQIRPGFRWGVVKTVSPLTVDIAGLEYRADELLINALLATGEHPLQTGDQVICLPLDGDDSRYFILAKAVAT